MLRVHFQIFKAIYIHTQIHTYIYIYYVSLANKIKYVIAKGQFRLGINNIYIIL